MLAPKLRSSKGVVQAAAPHSPGMNKTSLLRRWIESEHCSLEENTLDNIVARRGQTAPLPPDDLFCNAGF